MFIAIKNKRDLTATVKILSLMYKSNFLPKNVQAMAETDIINKT